MSTPENNNIFANFINGLDDQNFSKLSDQEESDIYVHQDKADGVRLIGADSDEKFIYDVEVGSANFTTIIDTDLRDPSVSISFPSRLRYFEADELHRTIGEVFDVAYYGRHFTPRVQMRFGLDEKEFDLANYWDGRGYEKAINDQPTSIFYYIPKDVSGYPQGFNASSTPQFVYGFSRETQEEIVEFMKMSHLKGSIIDADFSQELLKRNKKYLGKDLEVDGVDMRNKIQGLCKTHPQQTLGF